MYFISSGVCEIISSHSKMVVKAIADGCYFGDVACLLSCRRTAGVRAKVSTVLFSVSKESLNTILAEHHHMQKYMELIAQKRKVRPRPCPRSPDNWRSIRLTFRHER